MKPTESLEMSDVIVPVLILWLCDGQIKRGSERAPQLHSDVFVYL